MTWHLEILNGICHVSDQSSRYCKSLWSKSLSPLLSTLPNSFVSSANFCTHMLSRSDQSGTRLDQKWFWWNTNGHKPPCWTVTVYTHFLFTSIQPSFNPIRNPFTIFMCLDFAQFWYGTLSKAFVGVKDTTRMCLFLRIFQESYILQILNPKNWQKFAIFHQKTPQLNS